MYGIHKISGYDEPGHDHYIETHLIDNQGKNKADNTDKNPKIYSLLPLPAEPLNDWKDSKNHKL